VVDQGEDRIAARRADASRRVPPIVFGELDFIYLPSRDVAADIAHFTTGMGGELVFAVERFETRVAMVRLTAAEAGPALVLAEHLEGDQPILVFRVDDVDAAIAELQRRGVALGSHFEMPYGVGIQVSSPGPQRLALYERSRPERGDSLAGRRDF
jgi:hypothetical protein